MALSRRKEPLGEPPELLATAQAVQPAVERIVRRCLEKDPGQRFQTAKDLKFALEILGANGGQQRPVLEGRIAQNRWRIISLALAVIALAALALALRDVLVIPQQPEYRQLTFRRGSLDTARFAPDGQTIVYSAAWDRGEDRLYSSRVDGTTYVRRICDQAS